ncbi:hypothetical protein L211DRAFT_844798 [Terfezia boudieri ATCC MYA-4762]|uniref:Uncharacterized protein n=1 Tax=Terfezia boudieri ATCC MYA-4762 TaxID=1051890 RepID=A0A3N4M419_9PEZI|nr:hypothetical protein L211DRAFT_844798 [Terfezia boudieri ATCC MYA-4762]
MDFVSFMPCCDQFELGMWFHRINSVLKEEVAMGIRLTGLCPDHTGALDSNHRDRGQGGIEHVQVHSTVISPAVAGGWVWLMFLAGASSKDWYLDRLPSYKHNTWWVWLFLFIDELNSSNEDLFALIHIPGYGLIIDVISFFTPETSLSSGIKKESFNSICRFWLYIPTSDCNSENHDSDPPYPQLPSYTYA